MQWNNNSRWVLYSHFQQGQVNQTINEEITHLNCVLEQVDLIDTQGTFHPTATEHMFLSSSHGLRLAKKQVWNLGRWRSYQVPFLIKMVWNYKSSKRSEARKCTNMCKLSNTLMKKQCMCDEIEREILRSQKKSDKWK